ncbi:MAG: iron-sulfur cluster assembly scaffold protein [Chloroflexi bacterium]|nr:MAG: iron-sulfur cluster assembly scaffold protein [Chloroflexota bacterium]
MDDFDRFVNDLQREIDERTHALYSDKVLAEVRNPRNMSRMDAPDAYASVRGPCGDTMKMYLRLDGERIIEATFTTDGCGPTVASGSKLTTMVQGMSLAEADALTPDDLLAALDGLPAEHVHCAVLAVDTLHQALANQHP